MIDSSNISFVITSFKSEENIYNCINSIPAKYEKIIIENSNDAELKKKLESKYQNLSCYLMKENLGYGKANNIGINYSKKKFIFIVNPDIVFPKDSLEKIFEILKNQEFSIAGLMENNNSKENALFKNKEWDAKEVDFVRGYAMILNREKMFNILFDENIFLYLEEIDLCQNIKNKNGKIKLLNIFVNHLGGKSHGNKFNFQMEKSRNWHWMWSLFYFNKKHKGYFYALILTLPKFLNSCFKFLFYALLFKKNKSEIYKMRMLGLFNSYILKKSFYRPLIK